MKLRLENRSPVAQTSKSAVAPASSSASRYWLPRLRRFGSLRAARPGGLRHAPNWTRAVLALLLSGGCLRAQQPDNSPPADFSSQPIFAAPTNDTIQPEEVISALRAVDSGEPMPGDEANATNPFPADAQTNDPGSVNRSQPQSYQRPSGRESRSRWSSQRSNSAWSSYRSRSALPSTATNAGPRSLDYSAFGLIAERNIFDPNRHPNYRPNYQPVSRTKDPDYFALVGTMSYRDGTFAFFSGSSSDYQASLKCGGTIAGYQLSAIGSDSVKLALGTNQLDLRIGMQLRRNDDGSWTESEAPSSYTVSSFEPSAASNSVSLSGSAPSGQESDILKRLMEKREKE